MRSGKMSSVHPFNSEALDFAPAGTPTQFVMICATPRSGSTFLCAELWKTGAFGAPHEYYNFHSVMLQMCTRLGARNLVEYRECLLASRTGPNGVFALKLHFDHMVFLSRLAGGLSGFEPARFIEVYREDEVAQAVSWEIAEQTGGWTSLHGASHAQREPAYDREKIELRLRRLRDQRRSWDRFFVSLGVVPKRVRYESLVEDPGAAVGDVARHLQVGPDAVPVAVPALDRQSTPEKRQWVARYRDETGS